LTTPLPADDYLYGVNYKPEPVKCSCGSTKLYTLNDTEHYMCLDCGKQWSE